MPLDPQVQSYLEAVAGLPPMHTLPVDEARRTYQAGVPATFGPVDDVESVADRRIPRPGGELAVRIYEPAGAGPGTLVYLHGGGWVIGSLDTHDGICRALARRAGCKVVSVDYRLAPEHPYPAGLVDAWAATAWAIHTATGPVAVGGDSAGGNLAAVVALRARDRGFPLALQLLLYPATDAAMNTESHRALAEGYRLTGTTMRWYWDLYTGDADPADPEISPLLAPDVSGVAPAFVSTAEYDPLRDEGEAYAQRLEEAGVVVALRPYEGLIHGFYTLGGLVERSSPALDDAAAALAAAFARTS